jgi:hypothetical protein
LRTAKDQKDALPPPPVIPYTTGTITRLDAFQPVYRSKFLAVSAAKNAQTAATALVNESRQMGIYLVHDFIEALNRAIRRKVFLPSVRSFYQLNVNDDTLPTINTEAQLITWGLNLKDGEAARIAAGGVPITFPAIADVDAAIDAFKNANHVQSNAKMQYDTAQEILAAENPEADKLILKMWNETETAFDEGDKASMRRKAREWGVVYVTNPGEAPGPDDYSIMGTVTDNATGNPINEAVVLLSGTDIVELTDAQGKYLIPVQPPGTYTLTFYKNAYQIHEVRDIAVTETAIATVNAALQAAPPTGTITGKVLRAGMGVSSTVSIDGYPVSIFTDANGSYTINDAPSGNLTLRAYVNDNPGNQQTQSVSVPEGGTVTVDFNF